MGAACKLSGDRKAQYIAVQYNNSGNKMRKYYPIWRKLKRDGIAIVVHPQHLHRRLIKAVLKERTMDTGFRLELSETNKSAKVLSSSDGNLITFKLKYYLDPTDI